MNGGRRRRWRGVGPLLGVAVLSIALAQIAPVQPAPVQPNPVQPIPVQLAPVQVPPAPSGTSAAAGPVVAVPEGTSVSLTRKAKDGSKRLITVVRTGNSDATGVFVACQPLDDDPPGTPTISVFSETGAGGIRVTIDKNLIVAPLALVIQKDGGDGHIEVSAGTARALDDVPAGATDRLGKCAIEAKPATVPDSVNVTQGKTRLKGSKLVYDDSDGVARIAGPITFARQNQSGTLTGTSASIEVNVDDKTTTLVGAVTLQDGARTSSAERVEYDDAANVAILRGTPGSPARSVTADQTLTASVIRYNLDTGSVVALGPVGGEFQDSAPSTVPLPAGVSAPTLP
ncbi:LptA/OstA family protein [Deinococcus radiomollis]|uniref:LptA/OstA family protein n=1 Tax=Deinococcus radiomollis TaxID=468916 RepID=UPI0038921FC9